MKVGFTGTQAGTTLKQRGELHRWLHRLRRWSDIIEEEAEFCHGLCIGADAEAHEIVRALGYYIDGRPSTVAGKTAAIPRDHFRHLYQPLAPLIRNHDIVDWCDVLICCPRERREVQRSGTWATWRYASEKGRTIVQVFP